MKRIIRLIYGITYIFGASCLITLGHELWHYFECGGSFIAGINYINGEFISGRTYCANGGSGELIPRIISTVGFLFFAYILIKRG